MTSPHSNTPAPRERISRVKERLDESSRMGATGASFQLEDIAYLLGEVERLTKERNDALEDNAFGGAVDGKVVYDMQQTIAAIRAENAELLKELEESARLHGMGGGREAKLLADRDRAIAERDTARKALQKTLLIVPHAKLGCASAQGAQVVDEIEREARAALAQAKEEEGK